MHTDHVKTIEPAMFTGGDVLLIPHALKFALSDPSTHGCLSFLTCMYLGHILSQTLLSHLMF